MAREERKREEEKERGIFFPFPFFLSFPMGRLARPQAGFRANAKRLITDKLSRDSAILFNNYFTRSSNRNLLDPGFQGVR